VIGEAHPMPVTIGPRQRRMVTWVIAVRSMLPGTHATAEKAGGLGELVGGARRRLSACSRQDKGRSTAKLVPSGGPSVESKLGADEWWGRQVQRRGVSPWRAGKMALAFLPADVDQHGKGPRTSDRSMPVGAGRRWTFFLKTR